MTGPKAFKFCKWCESSKSVEDFYRRSTGYLSAWCKACTIKANNYAKAQKRHQAREVAAALPPAQKKRCTQCGEDQPLSAYYGKHAECKTCFRERIRTRQARPEVRARIAQKQIEYRERVRPSIRAKTLARYGIKPDDYDARYAEQGGCCKICGAEGDRLGTGGQATRSSVLVVDHCHDSGSIRGLLCNRCNRAIGLLGDNPDTLRRAIAYLTTSRREVTPTELEAATDG